MAADRARHLAIAMKTVIRRTTLIVRDIEKSARWYEHVLGLTRWYDSPYTLSGIGLAAGKKGDKTHLIIFKCEDPSIGMIGLLQWIDPPLPAPREIPTSITYGSPTFIAGCDDVDEAYRRALELDTQVHAAPHIWSTTGAKGEKLTFKSISIFDPDGYFYELNQELSRE